MFKSILRTLPTLSGNFKLNCNVTKIKQVENNIYNGYINNANIIPLKESLLSNGVKIALLNDSYEFDVAKYYYRYNDNFYNENFLFNKNDYQILNKYNKTYSRNKDYEFGCDRTSFKQTGYQFCFYAPIYCDTYESLPDYFEIKIDFGNNLTKLLRIKIKDQDSENYLRIYLKKYLDKINNNSIYMLPKSKQATYDGINVKNGGFSMHSDDIVSQIYNEQMTINNFDYLLCSGFKRNNMIMKQVIPLAFSFNINDILTNKEIIYRKNSSVNITGNYVKNSKHLDFFDFRCDYTEFNYKYLTYDPNNKLFKYNLSNNILNKDFPSLKESRYIKYKYSNKLTAKYTSWKLKYSNDNYPYYTNLNYSFSSGQNNIYKYGEFPSITITGLPAAIPDNNNLLMVIDDTLNTNFNDENLDNNDYFSNLKNYNYIQYKNAMNNYISNWFSLKSDFAIKDSWKTVEDNKVYYNGILYNLSEISNKYNIKKFGIFINPDIKIINKYSDNYKTAKYLISIDKKNKINNKFNVEPYTSKEDEMNIIIPGIVYNLKTDEKNCDIKNNILVKLSNKYGQYKEIKNYTDNNQYFDLNIIDKLNNFNNIINNFFDTNDINKLKTDKSIESYELIDIYNYSNIINDNIKNYKETSLYKLINNKNSELKLYYSYDNFEKINITKNNINKIYALISINDNDNHVYFYNSKSFISARDVYALISEKVAEKKISVEDINNLINDINQLPLYNYIPLIKYYNKTIRGDYFIKDNTKNEIIWVDEYNLNNLLPTSVFNKLEKKENIYAKFLNKENIKEYIYRKNDDKNSEVIKKYYDYIYIRKRYIVKLNGVIKLTDKYESLKNTIDKIFKNKYLAFNEFLDLITYNGNIFTLNLNNKIITFDLFFKDTFVKLNDDLYNYMFDENNNIKIALNLYKYNNSHENIYEYFDIPNEYYDNKNEFSCINNFALTPIFYSIYNSEYNNNYIKNLFDNKDIIKYNNNYLYNNNITGFITLQENDILFDNYNKYEDNIKKILIKSNIISEINYNKNNFNNTKLPEDLIKLIINYINLKDYNLQYQMYIKIIEKLKNIIINPKTDNDYIIKEILVTYLINNNMMPEIYFIEKNDNVSLVKDDNVIDYINNINIIKNDDNTYNAYYMINVVVNNSNISINTINKINNIKYYDTINNIDFKLYAEKNFKIIYPFLLTNIFILFKSYINTIIELTQLKFNIKYCPKIKDNGKTSQSYLYSGIFYDNENIDTNVYDLIAIKDTFTININRYLDNITPVLYKINNNIIYNVYQLYYKDINSVINSNNIYKSNINIYKYEPLHICYDYNNITHNIKTYNYYETEYKSYNDNKFYNLENEIIINIDKEFTYNELLEYEKHENILYEFKKYLNINKNHKLSDDEILFLYNKYDIQCLSESKKINSLYNKKLYLLKLKFTLK